MSGPPETPFSGGDNPFAQRGEPPPFPPPQPTYFPPPQYGYPVKPPPPPLHGPPAPFPVATYGRRATAYLIDVGLVVGFLWLAVGLSLPQVADSTQEAEPGAVWGIALLGFLVGWPLFVALTRGATPGKAFLGLRTWRHTTGKPLGFGWAILRDMLARAISAAIFPLLIVDLLWPLWDPHKQSLHDKLLRTQVLQRDALTGSRVAAGIAGSVAAVLLFAGGLTVMAVRDANETATGYDADDRAAFVEACSEGKPGDEDYCHCTFSYIERNVEPDEYHRYNRSDDDTPTPGWIEDAATACEDG